MKQNTFKWLSYSLILLASFSCKKQKGVLDDFPRGKFDFVYLLNSNTNYDTIMGEVSGPYAYSGYYSFIIRQEVSMNKLLKGFIVGDYNSIINERFLAQPNTSSTITYEEHDSYHLLVHFASGDTLSGSLILTRKE